MLYSNIFRSFTLVMYRPRPYGNRRFANFLDGESRSGDAVALAPWAGA